MSVTMGETETDWFTALDFEHQLACEIEVPECDLKSEWAVRLKCCGQLYLVCDHHWTMAKTGVLNDPNFKVVCRTCNHRTILSDFYGQAVRI